MSKHLAVRRNGTTVELPATLPEAHKVILSLLDVIDDLRTEDMILKAQVAALKEEVADLKEQLNQHSGNSSKPPSQGTPTGNKKGAQPGHRKHSRMMADEAAVDGMKHYYPDGQCACGGDIALEAEPRLRHQVFDLPEVKYTVTEHRVYAGCCTRCGKHCQGVTPTALIGLIEGLAVFRVIERLGKSFRGPPRDAWLAAVAARGNRGYAFGVHKALDKSGAVLSVLVLARVEV